MLGVTATPARLDSRGLDSVFQTMVLGPSMRDLQERGYLCRYTYLAPPVVARLDNLKVRAGEYAADELARAMDQRGVTGNAEAYYRKMLNGKPAIAFCASVEHAENVSLLFQQAGWKAACVDGSMDRITRSNLIASIGDGRLNVLCSCDIISEGTDIPVVQGAIMLRPTMSLVTYMQQAGRVLRPKPDGSRAIILDHCGNVRRHGLPDAPRDWDLTGAPKRPQAAPVRVCAKCYATFAPAPRCPECGVACVSAAPPRKAPKIVAGDLTEVMNPALKDGACKCRRLDGPACGSMTAAQPRDVLGCCSIGRASMPARDAPKCVAIRAVALIDGAATRASAARVARVDGDKRHAFVRGLVAQEGSQLPEGPTAKGAALRLSNRCPVADARQVLDGDSTSGVFSLPHDLLADAMVEVGGKPPLLAPPLAQQAHGRLGSFLLEVPSQASMAATEIGVVGTAEGVAIVIGSDVLQAEINAEIVGRIAFGHVAHIHRHVEEEFTIAVDQIGLTAREGKTALLVGTRHPRHDFATFQCKDRDAIQTFPRQDALIVGDGAVRSESGPHAAVTLVDLDYFGDSPHRHLGRKTEAVPGVVVDELLQLDLVCAVIGVRNFSNRIASRVAPLNCFQKRGGLLWRRQELGLHRQVHTNVVAQSLNTNQALPSYVWSAIPPRPESRGFSRRFR